MKYNALIGVSVLPALFIMPAMADTIDTRTVIVSDTTYTDLTASNIASTTSNNGGVFYMQEVPNVTLTFDGATLFDGNSLNDGGMGGAIGNGWLSSTSGSGYTQGGKIVFNGDVNFAGNSTNNANGGGAIFNYGLGTATNPDIVFYDAATFSGNSVSESMNGVYAGGGAINHRNGMIVFNSDATFDSNESASQGGAIMAAGDMIFNGSSTFTGNTAGKNGGALAIMGGDTLFEGVATFTGNTATGASALYIRESTNSVTFRDAATFSNNTGVGTLLNSVANATVEFDHGATFSGNTNNLNGALVNAGIINGISGDFLFADNTGSNGGGLKNSGTVNLDTTGKIEFSNNTTTSTAGALDNGGNTSFAASSTSFVGNKSDAGYGGAIFNSGDLSIESANNVFRGNTASDTGTIKSGGGAIHNRGQTDTASLVIGTDDSVNIFAQNSSAAYGGALVSRAFDGAGQDSSVVINGATTFSGNTATLDGGAIWNAVLESDGTTGTSTIVFNGDTSFIGNTSGGMGGALYNNDTVTFNGATTFSDNTANGVANDIYNDGTVNLNGDTVVSGGIDGTGTLNIASGTTLNIGTSTLTQGAVALNGTMLATLRAGDASQINVTNDGGFTGDGTLRLSFDSAGTYKVFGGQDFANLDIGSSIYDLVWDGGDVTATIKSTAAIASENNLSEVAARTVANVSASTSSRLNNLSVLVQENLASGDAAGQAAVEHAMRAINPELDGVSQSVGVTAQNTLNQIVSGRMTEVYGMGRNGGDINVMPGGIWAQGIYNKTKLNDSFNGYTRGVSVGFDGTVNDAWTMGVGYMYGHSDIGATTRNTEIDSHSIFAYGQYRPSNWYMNAIMNYTMSDYTEDGSALGLRVSSDYDIDAFGANVAVGYDFIGGLTPELSLRYIHLGSADYTNSLGIRSKIDSTDYMTASMGTHYGFDLLLTNGIVLRPTMRYAVKYDLISDDNNITVAMPGVNTYVLNGERLSRIANEVGIGLDMMYGSLNLSLNYDIEARADYTSQTGRIKFRYEF